MPEKQRLNEQDLWNKYGSLKVSSDRLYAYLFIKKPDCESELNLLTFSGLTQWISNHGIVFGVDHTQLQIIVLNIGEHLEKELEIAKGVAPTPGKNAELQIYVANAGPAHPEILADGRVNFFHVTEIQNVHAGMVVAKKVPVKPGVDGMDVYGKLIPYIKPKDMPVPTGKNVQLADDGLTLIAAADGQVVYTPSNHQLNIFQTYTVNGNVDFSVGNINFIGSVHIFGNVSDGFRVEAEGDIQIDGTVGAAIVQAGGNIVIHGGIQARGKGLVQAAGTISTRFIQAGKVIAGVDCLVMDSIMHSDVTAMRNVIVSSHKSVIAGGVTRAGERISAKNLGSPMATATEFICGLRPDLLKELEDIDKCLRELTYTKDKSVKALALFHANLLQGKTLTPDKMSLKESVEKTLAYTETQIQEKLAQRNEIEQQLLLTKNAAIVAEDRVYPGVKIFLCNHTYHVLDLRKNTRFIVRDGEIILESV